MCILIKNQISLILKQTKQESLMNKVAINFKKIIAMTLCFTFLYEQLVFSAGIDYNAPDYRDINSKIDAKLDAEYTQSKEDIINQKQFLYEQARRGGPEAAVSEENLESYSVSTQEENASEIQDLQSNGQGILTITTQNGDIIKYVGNNIYSIITKDGISLTDIVIDQDGNLINADFNFADYSLCQIVDGKTGKIITPDGTQYFYTPDSLVEYAILPDGKRIDYAYIKDSDSNIIATEIEDGESKIVYDANNRIETLIDKTKNKKVEYNDGIIDYVEFSDSSRLYYKKTNGSDSISVQADYILDSSGNKYVLDDNNKVISIVTVSGVILTNLVFDTTSKITSTDICFPGGQIIKIENDRIVETTLADGTNAKYTYVNSSNILIDVTPHLSAQYQLSYTKNQDSTVLIKQGSESWVYDGSLKLFSYKNENTQTNAVFLYDSSGVYEKAIILSSGKKLEYDKNGSLLYKEDENGKFWYNADGDYKGYIQKAEYNNNKTYLFDYVKNASGIIYVSEKLLLDVAPQQTCSYYDSAENIDHTRNPIFQAEINLNNDDSNCYIYAYTGGYSGIDSTNLYMTVNDAGVVSVGVYSYDYLTDTYIDNIEQTGVILEKYKNYILSFEWSDKVRLYISEPGEEGDRTPVFEFDNTQWDPRFYAYCYNAAISLGEQTSCIEKYKHYQNEYTNYLAQSGNSFIENIDFTLANTTEKNFSFNMQSNDGVKYNYLNFGFSGSTPYIYQYIYNYQTKNYTNQTYNLSNISLKSNNPYRVTFKYLNNSLYVYFQDLILQKQPNLVFQTAFSYPKSFSSYINGGQFNATFLKEEKQLTYNAAGNIQEIYDINSGTRITFLYDANNKLTGKLVTYSNGTSKKYNSCNMLEVENLSGSKIEYFYNNNQLIYVIPSNGKGYQLLSNTQYQYADAGERGVIVRDSEGNIRQYDFYTDPQGLNSYQNENKDAIYCTASFYTNGKIPYQNNPFIETEFCLKDVYVYPEGYTPVYQSLCSYAYAYSYPYYKYVSVSITKETQQIYFYDYNYSTGKYNNSAKTLNLALDPAKTYIASIKWENSGISVYIYEKGKTPVCVMRFTNYTWNPIFTVYSSQTVPIVRSNSGVKITESKSMEFRGENKTKQKIFALINFDKDNNYGSYNVHLSNYCDNAYTGCINEYIDITAKINCDYISVYSGGYSGAYNYMEQQIPVGFTIKNNTDYVMYVTADQNTGTTRLYFYEKQYSAVANCVVEFYTGGWNLVYSTNSYGCKADTLFFTGDNAKVFYNAENLHFKESVDSKYLKIDNFFKDTVTFYKPEFFGYKSFPESTFEVISQRTVPGDLPQYAPDFSANTELSDFLKIKKFSYNPQNFDMQFIENLDGSGILFENNLPRQVISIDGAITDFSYEISDLDNILKLGITRYGLKRTYDEKGNIAKIELEGVVYNYENEFIASIVKPDGTIIKPTAFSETGAIQDAEILLTDGSIRVFRDGKIEKIISADGMVIYFTNEKMSRIEYPDGSAYQVSYSKDTSGNPIMQTYEEATMITRKYKNALLVEMQEPSGITTFYEYDSDSSERLKQVVIKKEEIILHTYKYNYANDLVIIEDETGLVNRYNKYNEIVSFTTPEGKTYQYSHRTQEDGKTYTDVELIEVKDTDGTIRKFKNGLCYRIEKPEGTIIDNIVWQDIKHLKSADVMLSNGAIFKYDFLNNTITFPDGTVAEISNNLVSKVTKDDGTIINYTYTFGAGGFATNAEAIYNDGTKYTVALDNKISSYTFFGAGKFSFYGNKIKEFETDQKKVTFKYRDDGTLKAIKVIDKVNDKIYMYDSEDRLIWRVDSDKKVYFYKYEYQSNGRLFHIVETQTDNAFFDGDPVPAFIEVTSCGYNNGRSANVYINGEHQEMPGTWWQYYWRGYNIYVLDEDTGEILDRRNFDVWLGADCMAEAMANYIKTIPNGSFIVMAIDDEGSDYMSDYVYTELEKLGAKLIRNVGHRDSWALIGRKTPLLIDNAIEEHVARYAGNVELQSYTTKTQIYFDANGSGLGLHSGEQLDMNIILPETPFLQQILGIYNAQQNEFLEYYTAAKEFTELNISRRNISLPDEETVTMTYDSSDSLRELKKANATITLYREDTRAEKVIEEDGIPIVEYKYDQEGDLTEVVMVKAREEAGRSDYSTATIEEETQNMLELLNEKEEDAKQDIYNQIKDIKNELDEEKETYESKKADRIEKLKRLFKDYPWKVILEASVNANGESSISWYANITPVVIEGENIIETEYMGIKCYDVTDGSHPWNDLPMSFYNLNNDIKDYNVYLAEIDKQYVSLQQQEIKAYQDLEAQVQSARANIYKQRDDVINGTYADSSTVLAEIYSKEAVAVVYYYYNKVLGRQPSDDETNSWVNKVKNEKSPIEYSELENSLVNSQEYTAKIADKAAIISTIKQELESFLAMTTSQKDAYLKALGFSGSVVNFTQEDINTLISYLQGQSVHFGDSAYLCLKMLVSSASNRQQTIKKLIIIDFLSGVLTGKNTKEPLQISLYAMKCVASFFKCIKTVYESLLNQMAGHSFDNRKKAIVHIDGDHYVVVKKISADSITYVDPSIGPEGEDVTETKEEFLRHWEGYALFYELNDGIMADPNEYITDKEAKLIRGAGWFKKLWKKITNFFEKAAPILLLLAIPFAGPILSAISTAISAVASAVSSVISMVGTVISTIGNIASVFGPIGQIVGTILNTVGNIVCAIGSGLGNALQGLAQGLNFVSSKLSSVANSKFGFQNIFSFNNQMLDTVKNVAVNYFVQEGLSELKLDPTLTNIASSFISGGIIGGFTDGTFSVTNAMKGAFTYGAIAGVQEIGEEIDLDPRLTNLFAIMAGAITEGTFDIAGGYHLKVEELLKDVAVKTASELAYIGVQELGEQIGIDPRISYLAGISMRSSINIGFGDDGVFNWDDAWSGVQQGLLQGVVSVSIDYLTDTLELDPLIANIGFSAIATALQTGLNLSSGQNIFQEMFNIYEKHAIAYIGSGSDSAWERASYFARIKDFTEIIREHGLEEALTTYASGFFNSVAVSAIIESGKTIGQYFAEQLAQVSAGQNEANITLLDGAGNILGEAEFARQYGVWDLMGIQENGNWSRGDVYMDAYGKLGYYNDSETYDKFGDYYIYQRIDNGNQTYAEIRDKDGNTIILIEPTKDGGYNYYNSYGEYVDAKINLETYYDFTFKGNTLEFKNLDTGVTILFEGNKIIDFSLDNSLGVLSSIDIEIFKNLSLENKTKVVASGMFFGTGFNKETIAGGMPYIMQLFVNDLVTDGVITEDSAFGVTLYEGNLYENSRRWIKDAWFGGNFLTNKAINQMEEYFNKLTPEQKAAGMVYFATSGNFSPTIKALNERLDLNVHTIINYEGPYVGDTTILNSHVKRIINVNGTSPTVTPYQLYKLGSGFMTLYLEPQNLLLNDYPVPFIGKTEFTSANGTIDNVNFEILGAKHCDFSHITDDPTNIATNIFMRELSKAAAGKRDWNSFIAQRGIHSVSYDEIKKVWNYRVDPIEFQRGLNQ